MTRDVGRPGGGGGWRWIIALFAEVDAILCAAAAQLIPRVGRQARPPGKHVWAPIAHTDPHPDQ